MTDPRYVQIDEKRFVIKDAALLERTVPKWLGQRFAFDLETTGLDWKTEHAVGIALTFDDGRSFYVCLEHTEVRGEILTKTKTIEVEGEPREEPVLTKTGKQSCFKDGTPKFKKVKTYVEQEVEYQDDQRTFPTVRYITDEDAARILRPLFEQPDAHMLAHNMKFDLHFTDNIGLYPHGSLIDTMLAAKLIDENRAVGLKELATEVLGRQDAVSFSDLPRYPGFSKEQFLGVPLEIGADYALRDTEMTLELWDRNLKDGLRREGVERAFYEVWMPLMVSLFEMEKEGIALDLDLVREVRKEYDKQRRDAEGAVFREGMRMVFNTYGQDFERIVKDTPYSKPLRDIESECDEVDDAWVFVHGTHLPIVRIGTRLPRVPWFNVGSNPQLQTLLYEHLGLQPPEGVRFKVMDNGKYSVDVKAIKTLAFYLNDESPRVLQDLQDYRKAEKFIGTYLDRFLSDADHDNHDTIHGSFNQTTAATGRLSSSNPNLQNIPSRKGEGEKARRMFVARPGKKLVVADYSMMELRVLAHYTLDPSLLQAFEEGKDLHILTGANQAGMTYEELYEAYKAGDLDAKNKRAIGKTSNFGLAYGLGPEKFRNELRVENGVDVSLAESKALIRGYDETFAVAKDWKINQVIPRLRERGYVLSAFGRKRRLPEIWSRDRYEQMRAERQAINFIIQGSCAEFIGYVIPMVQKELKKIGARLLLQVHDELVAEAPADRAEEAARIMERLMTEPINKMLRVPLVAEAGIGDTWGEAK